MKTIFFNRVFCAILFSIFIGCHEPGFISLDPSYIHEVNLDNVCPSFPTNVETGVPLPPQWVFSPWAWEDNINNRDILENIVDGYLNRNIALGAVLIDSPWEKGFNTFEWDEVRYPNPQGLIDNLHQKGIKVLLWIHTEIDQSGGSLSLHQEMESKGWFIEKDGNIIFQGHKSDTASFLDLSHPDALEWLKDKISTLIQMGVDGWKLDYVQKFMPMEFDTFTGPMTLRQYSDLYYNTFYEETQRSMNLYRQGQQAMIMARSNDPLFGDPQRLNSLIVQKEINTSGWLGDQIPSWGSIGLDACIKGIYQASKDGHLATGFDIGGYSGAQPEKELLIRWAQFGALVPIMQNGGKNEHRPWEDPFDQETSDIYQKYANLHQALVPYWYTLAVQSHFFTGQPIIQLRQTNDIDYAYFQPINENTLTYFIGEDIFYGVVNEKGQDDFSFTFPQGHWIDFWDNTIEYPEEYSINYPISLDKYPIFIRKGAILPLKASTLDSIEYYVKQSDVLTLAIIPDKQNNCCVYQETQDFAIESLAAGYQTDEHGNLFIKISGLDDPIHLRILMKRIPAQVIVDSTRIAQSNKDCTLNHNTNNKVEWCYEKETSLVWILLPSSQYTRSIIVQRS